MANPIAHLLRRWRYGEEIVIVSGLPRSGTSMMMKMLESGGLGIWTDGVRGADEDNPRGYYELERVKNLEKETDKSWLAEGRGRVLKVISHLLGELPDENFYRVIFMQRSLEEIVASQNTMLERRGEENPIEDAKAVELYRKHLIHARVMMRERRNFEALEVSYRDALDDAPAVAARVNHFLGGKLDAAAMGGAVERSLYRNRREDS